MFKWLKRKKKKEVYDYLSDSDKEVYDKINRGIPAGSFLETAAFLDRIEAIKEREGIK